MSFILFLLFFVLIIVLLVISTVFGFLRAIFRFGRKGSNDDRQQDSRWGSREKRSKVFDDNEGEYVDFEEVKDDK